MFCNINAKKLLGALGSEAVFQYLNAFSLIRLFGGKKCVHKLPFTSSKQ